MSNFPPFLAVPYDNTPNPIHGVSADPYAAAAQTVQEEPRRRGPRRVGKDPALAAPYGGTGETPEDAPKRKGRPPKAAVVPGTPLSTASLFQVLAGLQAIDVIPLTSCYETLNALPPEDRSRVLGFLNRVLG